MVFFDGNLGIELFHVLEAKTGEGVDRIFMSAAAVDIDETFTMINADMFTAGYHISSKCLALFLRHGETAYRSVTDDYSGTRNRVWGIHSRTVPYLVMYIYARESMDQVEVGSIHCKFDVSRKSF